MSGSWRIAEFLPVVYEMPLTRSFRTSRHTVKSSTNIILIARLESENGAFLAFGEASPRTMALTGDNPALARAFLTEAAEAITGTVFGRFDLAASLATVRETMTELEALADRLANERNRDKPYRATLAGLDCMLLDAAAKAHGVSVAVLLGGQDGETFITGSTISLSDEGQEETEARVAQQLRRFPTCRFKGSADDARNFDVFAAITRYTRQNEVTKTAWIDLNGAYEPEAAAAFVRTLVSLAKDGDIEGEIVIEQPVKKSSYEELCALQRLADELSSGTPINVTLMADESLWDIDDLRKLTTFGGCGAINIKVQKSGGLLKALDIAREAVTFNKDVRVYLGSMIGTSDLTSWSLINVAKALPRCDYITAGPRTNMAARVAATPVRFIGNTNEIRSQTSPGFGTDINLLTLAEFAAPEMRPELERLSEYAELSRREP